MGQVSTTEVAKAIQEQNSATREISSNVQSAAEGTSEVASSITSVQKVANDSVHVANNFVKSAEELSINSNTLRSKILHFLTEIKQAQKVHGA